MLRDRTTVKTQPGLFLQPFIVSQLSGAVIADVVAGSEVTATEFAVTSWLDIVGTATPTELATELGLSLTTLSAMIDRLVSKKQVKRAPHPLDGRSYLLELTAAGKKTNSRNGRRFNEALQRLRSHLEGDSDEVLVALRRLEDGLRAMLEN
jgi:DNA-binding MarR family transcriptional regulator